MNFQRVCLALVVAASVVAARTNLAAADGEVVVLRAAAFGVKADGTSDDGPAIERMLEAAADVTSPVCLKFAEGGTVRVETAEDRYAFRFQDASDVTLDGGGSTFLLGPRVRFLRLTGCRRVAVRNLSVDFDPLPLADGTVVAVDRKTRSLDVRLRPGVEPPLGGPTGEDGEQAFFGMLWHDGPYGLISRHYWIERIEAGGQPGIVRAVAAERFREFGDIRPGSWRISLPVPGIAHRFGPGACFDLRDNDTLTFEDVELWSAPWFGFHVMRNRGPVVFRRVNIRSKPGSGRLTSTWRDGFHVKGNSGSLLWEDCILSGMNDDAMNLSTHTSRVTKMLSPTEIVVQQTFPLNPMPWHEGAQLAAADFDSRTLVGTARVVKVTESPERRTVAGRPAAAPVMLELDRPVAGLGPGTMVWQPDYANPHTTLRRCRIEMSCRLQSPVTVEQCDVTGLLWFYGERVEGPFPSHVTLRDCTLRRGRGNPRLAVSFAGHPPGAAGPSAIHDVAIVNNDVWGDFSMVGVDDVRLDNNRFHEPGATVRLPPGVSPDQSPAQSRPGD